MFLEIATFTVRINKILPSVVLAAASVVEGNILVAIYVVTGVESSMVVVYMAVVNEAVVLSMGKEIVGELTVVPASVNVVGSVVAALVSFGSLVVVRNPVVVVS